MDTSLHKAHGSSRSQPRGRPPGPRRPRFGAPCLLGLVSVAAMFASVGIASRSSGTERGGPQGDRSPLHYDAFLDWPELGDAPADVVVRRLVLPPGASWEVPARTIAFVGRTIGGAAGSATGSLSWYEQGAEDVRSLPPINVFPLQPGYGFLDGDAFDAWGATGSVLRHRSGDAAAALLVTIGPIDHDGAPPVDVDAEPLGRVRLAHLPAGAASILAAREGLGGHMGSNLGTARTVTRTRIEASDGTLIQEVVPEMGFLLTVVEEGTVQLGRPVAPLPAGNAVDTTPSPPAGAFISVGGALVSLPQARPEVRNVGDGAAWVVVLHLGVDPAHLLPVDAGGYAPLAKWSMSKTT